MTDLDARAQLAVFAALVLATLFGGGPGLAIGAIAAAAWIAARPERTGALRVLAAAAPLAVAVAILDAIAGRAAEGLGAALRLVAVTGLAISFARTADARAMASALRALRIPYPVVFVLVTGARFVPLAAADLGDLTDAARLRGLTVRGTAWRRLADWTALLVPLLILTIRRGLQLGEAMEARGFSGAAPARTAGLRWRRRDTLAVAAAAAGLAAVVVAGAAG